MQVDHVALNKNPFEWSCSHLIHDAAVRVSSKPLRWNDLVMPPAWMDKPIRTVSERRGILQMIRHPTTLFDYVEKSTKN